MNQNLDPVNPLETQQLTLAYDGAPIIRNLSLVIPPPENHRISRC
jgi:hypothetical protein